MKEFKRDLSQEEATDLRLSDIAYESPDVIVAHGEVGGFIYDSRVNNAIEETLERKGIHAEETGFQAATLHNPDTGEWKITFAGTTGWVDLVEDRRFISGNYVYEGEKTIRPAVMWVTCHAIPVGRLNTTRHKHVT